MYFPKEHRFDCITHPTPRTRTMAGKPSENRRRKSGCPAFYVVSHVTSVSEKVPWRSELLHGVNRKLQFSGTWIFFAELKNVLVIISSALYHMQKDDTSSRKIQCCNL